MVREGRARHDRDDQWSPGAHGLGRDPRPGGVIDRVPGADPSGFRDRSPGVAHPDGQQCLRARACPDRRRCAAVPGSVGPGPVAGRLARTGRFFECIALPDASIRECDQAIAGRMHAQSGDRRSTLRRAARAERRGSSPRAIRDGVRSVRRTVRIRATPQPRGSLRVPDDDPGRRGLGGVRGLTV